MGSNDGMRDTVQLRTKNSNYLRASDKELRTLSLLKATQVLPEDLASNKTNHELKADWRLNVGSKFLSEKLRPPKQNYGTVCNFSRTTTKHTIL